MDPAADRVIANYAVIQNSAATPSRIGYGPEHPATGSAWTSPMHDFYSDTRSRPTRAMLEAILSAEFGDEQSGGDPTTNRLCATVAEMLGKEAAVLLPSGTMCNEIAIRVHCRPGDEVIAHEHSHIIGFEAGGPASLSGVMIRAVAGPHGTFGHETMCSAIRPKNRYNPESRLVSVEQTANLAGGAVWPLATLQSVATAAKQAGLATHMDGARLLNACVASGVSASEYTEGFDSCWIDFSKGLGAPVGAVLAGSSDFIDRAWRFKQQWGGAMRQSGVIAATCLYALEHNVDRLADDHALAARIAALLESLPGVAAVLPVTTNIVIFDLSEHGLKADQLVEQVGRDGCRIGAFSDRRIRIVTHLGVNDAAGDRLCTSLQRHLG